MCGIAGIVRFDGRPVRTEEIRAMTDALAHRGPDDQGQFVERGAGIGMRRLSIIDLSPHGHQPMTGEDPAIQVVFNGEIYNFKDLRSTLVAKGHVFKSESDTEVIVHGYEELGAEGVFQRLEGMFAVAILDRKKGKLFIGRGPFGIKPLYLRRSQGQLSFASEIRPLALDGAGPLSADPSFVGSFLRLGYVTSPHSAFKGVVKLAHASMLEIELGSGATRESRHYDLLAHVARPPPEEDQLSLLREYLNLAVRRQLVADVPVGVFLSGGLDSSTISALASRHAPGALKTFSVGFQQSDRGDESAFAAQVARQLKADHTNITIGPDALLDLDAIVESLEEPLADSAVIPLWHLCRGTARHVKVALSGEGGDEVLGGYARYFWGLVASRVSDSPVTHLVAAGTRALPSRSRGIWNITRRANKFAESMALAEAARYLSWFDLFTDAERRGLSASPSTQVEARIEELFSSARSAGLDPVQRLQYVDFSTMLLDNLLLKSDKLSMAASLEVRVPMLDRPLVELGFSLPVSAKVSPRAGKVLLRKFVEAELPRKIARRPKRGFEIPVDQWFRAEAARPLRERLSSGVLVKTLDFDARAIEAMVARHVAGEDLGRKLFALATLESWTRRFC